MVDTQHFCLRWNNYQSSITTAFENLRDDEDFVDVTLACDGKSLKAHRVVLSACSPYFRELLKSTPCKHPVIVLQDVAFTDLHALVEFIYHGEVNVHQRSLSSFLKTAEVLRVSGLTQNDDAQGPILQSLARASTAAPSPHTPPHPAHTPLPAHPPHTPHPPLTPSYTEKLEDALLYPQRRVTLPPRRLSRAESSPDIKRVRHDNNNDQIHDFSTKGAVNNNGNGISNSSSSPSPRLMDEVKHEPLDMCPPDAERDDTPPHTHHRPHGGGPPSRGSSAEADDRTPPPLPHPPFISPAEKLFGPQHNFSYSMSPLTDASLAGLPSPLAPDGMASTSQGKKLFSCKLCAKVLCSKASLKRHIADKHAEKQEEYRCTICERVYCSRNSLMTHIYTYHKARQGEPDAIRYSAPPYAPAHRRRDQRAAGVSLLPQDILLLLLPEATLPRQARAVGHAVRVRVLPPEVPHQELADHAQEPAAPRLQRHAEAPAEDVGAALGAGAGAAPPVRPGRAGRAAAAAARPAMTSDHGLNRARRPAPRAPRALPHPRVQYGRRRMNSAARGAKCIISVVN